jgi:molecular chaperone DnaJ
VVAKRKRDYYEVLGVDRQADDAELKRAFRELARRYHPDVNPGDQRSEDRFKEANEAYAVLSDARARARYDRYGFAGVGQPTDGSQGLGSVVDMFDDLLGDILRRRKGRRRGRDLRYTLEVSFEEAAFGCEKTIRIPNAGGSEREFTVTIPPGTKEGAVRRLRGEGERGEGSGRAGDLHVIVRIGEHPMFSREGYDVWCEVPISFPQAALGAVIDVPTLDGPVRMRIPEGTQSGRVFRMRGKGVPRAAGKAAPRGDQFVRALVETPTELSERQRELLQKFADASGDYEAHPQTRGFLDKLRALFAE